MPGKMKTDGMCLRALSYGYSLKLEEVPAFMKKKRETTLPETRTRSINPVQKCFKENDAKADDQEDIPYSR